MTFVKDGSEAFAASHAEANASSIRRPVLHPLNLILTTRLAAFNPFTRAGVVSDGSERGFEDALDLRY